jgi:hypothetical protein
VIALGLRRQSPQNGNIRGGGRRLLAIGAPRSTTWESGDSTARAKARHFRPYLAFLGEPGRMRECLAGAGGFEPPYGGIKICHRGAVLAKLKSITTDKLSAISLSVRELIERPCHWRTETSGVLHSKNDSAASQRSSTFNVKRSSARVRPRFTAAIGMRRCAAAWAKRNPE